MPSSRYCSRIDTMELKLRIETKLGQRKAENYFNLLTRYLGLKVGKSQYDKLFIDLVGGENIRLHNEFIRSIVKNATLSKTPPPKGPLSVNVSNGFQKISLQSHCRDAFPQSPRKGRTPNLCKRKFKDQQRPLGPHGKIHSVAFEDLTRKGQEHQSAAELVSLSSRPPEVVSVEDGEEVEQASRSPGIYNRSPVRAPLGISIHTKETRKILCNGSTHALHTPTCHNSGDLPSTSYLKGRVDQKLEMEGVNVSVDCVNLLNNGLDVFLKGLLKPCLQLAGSMSDHKYLNQINYQTASVLNGTSPMRYIRKSTSSFSASMLDFRVAVESNPRILGGDWPVQLEKFSLRASVDYS